MSRVRLDQIQRRWQAAAKQWRSFARVPRTEELFTHLKPSFAIRVNDLSVAHDRLGKSLRVFPSSFVIKVVPGVPIPLAEFTRLSVDLFISRVCCVRAPRIFEAEIGQNDWRLVKPFDDSAVTEDITLLSLQSNTSGVLIGLFANSSAGCKPTASSLRNGEVAFIMLNLTHQHIFSTLPRKIAAALNPHQTSSFDDCDSRHGLYGHQIRLSLRNTAKLLWSREFQSLNGKVCTLPLLGSTAHDFDRVTESECELRAATGGSIIDTGKENRNFRGATTAKYVAFDLLQQDDWEELKPAGNLVARKKKKVGSTSKVGAKSAAKRDPAGKQVLRTRKGSGSMSRAGSKSHFGSSLSSQRPANRFGEISAAADKRMLGGGSATRRVDNASSLVNFPWKAAALSGIVSDVAALDVQLWDEERRPLFDGSGLVYAHEAPETTQNCVNFDDQSGEYTRFVISYIEPGVGAVHLEVLRFGDGSNTTATMLHPRIRRAQLILEAAFVASKFGTTYARTP